MIKVNTAMMKKCSRGVRRYYGKVLEVLRVEHLSSSRFEDQFKGFLTFDKENTITWSPGQGGSLVSKRHIVTCHDVIDFTYYRANLKNKIKRIIHQYIYSRALNIVFISDYTRSEFERVFPKNLARKTVIRSAINMEINFTYNADALVKNNLIKNQYFIMITNKMPHKNNHVFINAISGVSKKDIKAVIVGSLTKEEKELVSKNSRVLHFDALNNDDLFTLVQGSIALVSASAVEGHNLTIAEALTLKKAVIASDIAVHREFYNDFCIFFDLSNQNSLKECLNNVCDKKVSLPTFLEQDLKNWHAVGKEYQMLFNSYR